ncbi:AAA family ATPase [bacterium]|nr:AAA family ATPase [bacterium]
MKIPAITNRYHYDSKINQKNVPAQQKVNFKQITPKEIKHFTLGQRISHLLPLTRKGDVICVGNSPQEILDNMSNNVMSFRNIINNIIMIITKNLPTTLAFITAEYDTLFNHFNKDNSTLSLQNQIEVINIGEKTILYRDKSQNLFLSPSQAYVVSDKDKIITPTTNIDINIPDYSDNKLTDEELYLLSNPWNFANAIFYSPDINEEMTIKSNATALNIYTHQLQTFIEGSEPKSQNLIEKPGEKETNIESSTNRKIKKLSFKDIGGLDSTIAELKQCILYPIKYPEAYENVDLNRGIILYGKPGTGKTLLAEALAEESNAEFIKICATDLESKWIGETEAQWRDMFANAIEKQPSIIFIDEIDAVVKERGENFDSGHSDKVVNQILALMSDLEKSNDQVFIIATTNRPDVIDSAITRSGRFGKQIEIPAPDREGLDAIFDVHVRNKQLDSSLNKDTLIDKFVSREFTGADVKHIVNEAHTNSWKRFDVYSKMDEGILNPEDIKNISITEADFNLAIEEWDNIHSKKEDRTPIGYNRNK